MSESISRADAFAAAEPLLAAKVIRMANTLTLNPYRGQITSLGDAIQRIGLSTLRCLAFAVTAEDPGVGAFVSRLERGTLEE